MVHSCEVNGGRSGPSSDDRGRNRLGVTCPRSRPCGGRNPVRQWRLRNTSREPPASSTAQSAAARPSTAVPVEANGLARYPFQSSVLLAVWVSAHSCLPSDLGHVAGGVFRIGVFAAVGLVVERVAVGRRAFHERGAVTMARSVWVSPSLTPLSVPVTLTIRPA